MRNSSWDPPFIRHLLIKLNKDLDSISLYCPSHYSETVQELPIHRMILLLEDRRFFNHWGIDIWSLKRELFRYLTFRRHGGASTIDMQFVRTITGYRERTISRKIYEMILAFLIQYHCSKWQILQAYLDEAYFGSGLRGVRASSQALYERQPSQLGIVEAAELASLLVYPKPRNPSQRWKTKVDRRARYALQLNARFKKISK